ncbi:hypothetical protein pb186bvf_012056 [Paramecium bursaria]
MDLKIDNYIQYDRRLWESFIENIEFSDEKPNEDIIKQFQQNPWNLEYKQGKWRKVQLHSFSLKQIQGLYYQIIMTGNDRHKDWEAQGIMLFKNPIVLQLRKIYDDREDQVLIYEGKYIDNKFEGFWKFPQVLIRLLFFPITTIYNYNCPKKRRSQLFIFKIIRFSTQQYFFIIQTIERILYLFVDIRQLRVEDFIRYSILCVRKKIMNVSIQFQEFLKKQLESLQYNRPFKDFSKQNQVQNSHGSGLSLLNNFKKAWDCFNQRKHFKISQFNQPKIVKLKLAIDKIQYYFSLGFCKLFVAILGVPSLNPHQNVLFQYATSNSNQIKEIKNIQYYIEFEL